MDRREYCKQVWEYWSAVKLSGDTHSRLFEELQEFQASYLQEVKVDVLNKCLDDKPVFNAINTLFNTVMYLSKNGYATISVENQEVADRVTKLIMDSLNDSEYPIVEDEPMVSTLGSDITLSFYFLGEYVPGYVDFLEEDD